MADVVDATKVEEETTTTLKEVAKEKEVPVIADAVSASDEKKEAPVAAEAEPAAKEGENGSAAAEEVNGSSANGNGTNGTTADSGDATEKADAKDVAEEIRKRKSEGVEPDATDGVSAEKKAKLDEKAEEAAADVIDAPANGEAEVTA